MNNFKMLNYDFLTDWVTYKISCGKDTAVNLHALEMDRIFCQMELAVPTYSFDFKVLEILKRYVSYCIEFSNEVHREFTKSIFQTCEAWKERTEPDPHEAEWNEVNAALNYNSDAILRELLALYRMQGIEKREALIKYARLHGDVEHIPKRDSEDEEYISKYRHKILHTMRETNKKIAFSLDKTEFWESYKQTSGYPECLPDKPEDYEKYFGTLPFETVDNYIHLGSLMNWKMPDSRFLRLVARLRSSNLVAGLLEEFDFCNFESKLVDFLNLMSDDEAKVFAMVFISSAKERKNFESESGYTADYISTTLNSVIKVLRDGGMDCLRHKRYRTPSLRGRGNNSAVSFELVTNLRNKLLRENLLGHVNKILAPMCEWLFQYDNYRRLGCPHSLNKEVWGQYLAIKNKKRHPFELMVLHEHEKNYGSSLIDVVEATKSIPPKNKNRLEKSNTFSADTPLEIKMYDGTVVKVTQRALRRRQGSLGILFNKYLELVEDNETLPDEPADLEFLLGTYKYEPVKLYLDVTKRLEFPLDEESEYPPLLELLSDLSGMQYLQDVREWFNLENGKNKFQDLVKSISLNGLQERIITLYYVHNLRKDAIELALKVSSSAVKNYLKISLDSARGPLSALGLLKRT